MVFSAMDDSIECEAREDFQSKQRKRGARREVPWPRIYAGSVRRTSKIRAISSVLKPS